MMPPERLEEGGVMRFIGVVVAALALVQQAQAADLGLGVLRGAMFELGSPSYFRWSGTYAGGQYGYSGGTVDVSRAGASHVADALGRLDFPSSPASQWELLGRENSSDTVYGAFAGVNAQWDSAVLGLELNYNHGPVRASSSGATDRRFSDSSFVYDVTITSTTALDITDYGTVRGRAAYAFGHYLAYAFVGLALGRAEVTDTATVSGIVTPAGGGPSAPYRPSPDSESSTTFIYGYALGLGMDWAITRHLFLRGEYEFVQFSGFKEDIDVRLNTVRAAAGYKF
jgi:outer membrane immunogenic protein